MTDEHSWAEVVRRWCDDGDFRRAFTDSLASSSHGAFAWETVPVSATTQARQYEQVLTDSPSLARVRADAGPFRDHFDKAQGCVCTFANLRGDATLVAPVPTDPTTNYAHLAAFARSASSDEIDAFWSAVGRAVQAHWQYSDAPVWVSTAGLGVHWLHVRLDARPKYYRYWPFTRWHESSTLR